jgi:hypothetical protein
MPIFSNIFFNFSAEIFCYFEKYSYLCTRKQTKAVMLGALVQLVRMPACHAGGHESESRTHRNYLRVLRQYVLRTFFMYII